MAVTSMMTVAATSGDNATTTTAIARQRRCDERSQWQRRPRRQQWLPIDDSDDDRAATAMRSPLVPKRDGRISDASIQSFVHSVRRWHISTPYVGVLHSFPVVRLTSGSQPVFFHFIVLSHLHSNPLECPLIGERRQHPSPTPTSHSSLTQWQYSPPPLGPVAHISFPSPTSSGEGDLPASSTMPARQPRQRQPPKRFRAANSSSEDGDNEPPGSSIAPVSSRATSPSRTSSPMPLQQERPQVNRDLSDREKFDLRYEVTTKSLQEVLGMCSACDVE
ncbi:hypothetical protein EDB84DRAFT_1446634 [Lactarius hengduanensis]|nr:hypothetical protein EDB84DRAFT_1446634 [Lactarius hengduanensis]